MESINLSRDELRNLKKIGGGTDGQVFYYSNNFLLKIYHEKLFELNSLIDTEINNNDDDVKIYDRNQIVIRKYPENIKYFVDDGKDVIRLRSNDAIEKAIEKQKNVSRTELPKGIVNINNRFAGCFIKKINGIQIHKLSGMPTSYKKKILKSLLIDVEELLKNYIYHIDLSNSPFIETGYYDENGDFKIKKGHSHVLVNPLTCKTNIIDLDGKSTVYMEKYNETYERDCLINLNTLICEFLFQIDTKEYNDDDEIIYYELLKQGINNELSRKLSTSDFKSIDEIKRIIL